MVALGEGLHGNVQGHAFRLALVRDSRFPTVLNDIVVEFGNARYQPLMDRFISGEEISDRELRRVWQDTTMPNPLFDSPIYEEFLRAVRGVNASLPPEGQVRVLLGDPPIQWEHVTTTHCRNGSSPAIATPPVITGADYDCKGQARAAFDDCMDEGVDSSYCNYTACK